MVGDAMAGFQCSTELYLNIWLGLVGGCVGLWLPKGMAMPETSMGTNNELMMT
jgi:ubiquitin-like-conjugating enzyme ATG10